MPPTAAPASAMATSSDRRIMAAARSRGNPLAAW
jgi:hypothetical protein